MKTALLGLQQVSTLSSCCRNRVSFKSFLFHQETVLAYATYFKIFTDQDTIDFTRLQQKKFLVLYGLFYSKHEAKTTKEQSFFEYVDKFLQTNITAEN